MIREKPKQIMIVGMKEIIDMRDVITMKDIIKLILITIQYMTTGLDMIIVQVLINIKAVV